MPRALFSTPYKHSTKVYRVCKWLHGNLSASIKRKLQIISFLSDSDDDCFTLRRQEKASKQKNT